LRVRGHPCVVGGSLRVEKGRHGLCYKKTKKQRLLVVGGVGGGNSNAIVKGGNAGKMPPQHSKTGSSQKEKGTSLALPTKRTTRTPPLNEVGKRISQQIGGLVGPVLLAEAPRDCVGKWREGEGLKSCFSRATKQNPPLTKTNPPSHRDQGGKDPTLGGGRNIREQQPMDVKEGEIPVKLGKDKSSG